jgi:hypothetical protein
MNRGNPIQNPTKGGDEYRNRAGHGFSGLVLFRKEEKWRKDTG